MAIHRALPAEFDQEMAGTRKTPANLPDDKMGWKPHPKSFPMGTLARHLADLPNWMTETIGKEELEVANFPDRQRTKKDEPGGAILPLPGARLKGAPRYTNAPELVTPPIA